MNKWVAVAIIVLLAGVAVAQQELPPGHKEYKEGEAAIKKNDMDGAIVAFEKALAADPDLFASHYFLGFAYQSKRNYQKTAENFTAFLNKAGNNPEAAEQVGHATRQGGLAWARTKSSAKAIPYLEKAAAAKPNDKEVHYYLGMALIRDGQEGKAEQHFSKVIQLDPSLPRPYYFAGRVAFNTENWADARRLLSKYLELKPDNAFAADAHFMLGSMAIRQAEGMADPSAQHNAAKTHLNKFLELKPTAPQAPQAHYILGSLAAQSEDTATATAHFQKYLQLQPQGAQAEEVKQFLADLSEGEEEGS
jgi:tetratricopeptide (TPR) repeat protein